MRADADARLTHLEALTGQRIGPYQIVAPLGTGGMGAVYRARHASTGQVVAMKILPRQLALDPQFAGRFKLEALVVSRLKHPHIMPLIDYGQDADHAYMILPYLGGGTLADRLQGRPLSHEAVVQVITQIGGALDYAHFMDVVHRDVKPRNILVDAKGDYLLSDFGVVKLLTAASGGTGAGLAVGTPTYMSPEQGSGRKVDRRADLYSLGVILYEMVTGRVPFRAARPADVMLMHVQTPPPPPRSINPDVPIALERVILRALAKQPGDRFASAEHLIDALYEAVAKG